MNIREHMGPSTEQIERAQVLRRIIANAFKTVSTPHDFSLDDRGRILPSTRPEVDPQLTDMQKALAVAIEKCFPYDDQMSLVVWRDNIDPSTKAVTQHQVRRQFSFDEFSTELMKQVTNHLVAQMHITLIRDNPSLRTIAAPMWDALAEYRRLYTKSAGPTSPHP